MYLQLIDGSLGTGTERVESAVSESSDIITTTSYMSDDVSCDITAERRRELWKRANEDREV